MTAPLHREPISPELVLIDRELARPPDELETVMIDSPPTQHHAPQASLETLMFRAGLIDADQLGELVRDAVVSQRSIEALALERNLVTPQAVELLLREAQAEQPAAPTIEPDPEPEPNPEPVLEQAPAPVPLSSPAVLPPPVAPAVTAAVLPPQPAAAAVEPDAPDVHPHIALAVEPEPAPAPEPVVEPTPLHAADERAPIAAPAPGSFDVVVRLTSGETVRAGGAESRAGAEDLARTTARRFADASEWPLVAGRCLRPDLVVSVDVVCRFEDS